MTENTPYGISLGDIDWKWAPPVPDQDDILDGPGKVQFAELTRSADSRAVSGLWHGAPMRYRVRRQPWNETLVVLQGALTTTPENGEPYRSERNDILIAKVGDSYTVDVHEPTILLWAASSPDEPIDE